MQSVFDKPKLKRNLYVHGGDEPKLLALLMNSTNSFNTKMRWNELVNHVLDGITHEDVKCALGLDNGETFLKRCRRSNTFGQMNMDDVPTLSSLANWVRDMNFYKAQALESSLVALEKSMNALRDGISEQLWNSNVNARRAQLAKLIGGNRVHIKKQPNDACTPQYQPRDAPMTGSMSVLMCMTVLTSELAHASNTKRAVRIMDAAIADLMPRVKEYVAKLDHLKEVPEKPEMSAGLEALVTEIKTFDIDYAIHVHS